MHRLIAAVLFIYGMSLTADNAVSDVFLNTDIFELEIATDPQISPDGSQVAYVRRSMDIMTDRAKSNIWIIGSSGGAQRPLLSGTESYSNPRWSPAGDRLAYVSNIEGRGVELYVRWMDTGQTALLSNLPATPNAISWSPDGKQIAFSSFVEGEATTLTKPPKKPQGAKWAPPVKVIDTVRYRADGRGYLEQGFNQIFVIPAEGGTARQISSGDFHHNGPLSWSPDGNTIVLSANRLDDWEYQPLQSELWSITVVNGDLKQLTDRIGPDIAPVYSPDGSKIAYLGYDDRKMGYHNNIVYLMDTRDGSTKILTANFDRAVVGVRWAGSSNRLYIQYDDRGKRNLASLTMDGKIESIADNLGSTNIGRPYTSGSFSVADNGAFAYSMSRVDRPADVATGRRGHTITQLTNLNADLLSHKVLGEVEELTWLSSVGDHEIQGWIVTPPNFDADKKYPLILEIHGGPFAAYGPHFSAELQLYAAAGYVVLYTNPRGSTSYGDEFANEVHHNYPGQDYDDLMSGVDVVIAKGYVDATQLFVTGGSGGGVLSAWIVGKTDRFSAAVVAKPVINWTSTVLTTDIATLMPMYWFSKPPWEDQENYWRRSPLSLVGNVSTPTMLLTGENDHRTPISESEQYYQALKLRKIDTAMVRIPEASHNITGRPSHLIAKIDNILAWFAKYRKE